MGTVQAPSTENSMSEIYVTVITSCFCGPIPEVVERLARLVPGIQGFDLYCFQEADRAILPSRVSPTAPVSRWATGLHVAGAENILRQVLDGRHVAALATNLPTISSLDAKTRGKAVEALRRLCNLAVHLKARCVEIVCGSDIVDAGEEESVGKRVGSGPSAEKSRIRALVLSLAALNAYLNRHHRDVGIALEIEPGISHLLNGGAVLRRVLQSVDATIGRLGGKNHIGINLDVGHYVLLREAGDDLMPVLRDYKDRVLHAHASRHEYPIHCADLALRERDFDRYREPLQFYLSLYNEQPRSPYMTGAIALEQETAASEDQVALAYAILRNWVDRLDC